MSRGHRLAALLVWIGLCGCPAGDGTDGPTPIVRISSTPDCRVIGGGFPSGFAALPGTLDQAAVVKFGIGELAVIGLDLDGEPPTPLVATAPALPEVAGRCRTGLFVDSDSNGIADRDDNDLLGLRNGFPCGLDPQPGNIEALASDLVAVTTSGYEQILFFDPRDGELRAVQLDPPPAGPGFDPADWRLWPAAGVRPFQTGLSTWVCVYGAGILDSDGDPVGADPLCDPGRDGFLTSFTSDVLRSNGRLFVATSNLLPIRGSRFAPGTVLAFDFDESVSPPRAAPVAADAVRPTTGYNPTSLAAYTTPSGRELVLVGVTGALTRDGDLVTPSAIDVLDATSLDLIATIPLGFAGLGFDGFAIDATNRIAVIGAVANRALYAIDLAALDDPSLGLGPETLPIVLDGMTPGFPDARVYDAARPFELPKRADGPLDSVCVAQTSAAIRDDNGFVAATEYCDGTITRIDLSLPLARTTPLDPDTTLRVDTIFEALAPGDAVFEPRFPGDVLIRPGTPGIDYDGPDVHFTFGDPEGGVCGLRIDAI
ncbi:MAG: hypothetical protein NXI30_23970 [bacterium]|nr:hypothetical protein [bacterium]